MILIHQRHRRTDRRTDGRHAITIPRYALVHRAVKIDTSYQLRQLLGSIRRSLTTDAIGAHSLLLCIANRVDYCNAVLYGTSTALARRLQVVLYGRWYRIRAHYTGASWHSSVFTGCQSLRGYSSGLLLWPSTVSQILVLSTSSKSSAQSRICHVGHSARLAAVTCSFRGQTRPSASEVSPLRILSSGTHFHMTSAHHTSVAGSSDRSWRLYHLFRQAYNTAWFLWEQFLLNEECNSVTVTVNIRPRTRKL